MQNEPNLQDARMNVSKALTKDYENVHPHRRPKANPIKPNSMPKETSFLLFPYYFLL